MGLSDPEVNPFFAAQLPRFRALLGGEVPSLDAPVLRGDHAFSFAIDATLGVEGLPQSGTGQISILTGTNAAAELGRHFGPWPPVRLRPLLEAENLFRRAGAMGRTVAFANAYPKGWPGPLPWRRRAAPPLAALSAGILTRDEEALVQGDAVSSEIVNDGWRRYLNRPDLPAPTPYEAGQTLARIASTADLTFFAHWSTDTAGHRGGMTGGIQALERVDAFLGGVMDSAPTGLELLVVSDHGNLEDVRGGHTRNPALGLWAQVDGTPKSHPPFEDLTGVTPFLLSRLQT